MTFTVLWSGLALGVGLSLIAAWWTGRRISLEARVAPHLRPLGGWGVARVPRSLDRILRGGARFSERWGSPSTDVAARLRRAGSRISVEQFRSEQVLWSVAGLVAGLVAALFLAARGSSPVALTIMVGVSGLLGGAAREQMLTRAVTHQEARIMAELPAVADMLALSVSAGEGVLGALERVTRGTSGSLVNELRETLGEVRTGTPLAEAMHGLSERTGVAALSRFASGIAVAVERGTPLVDVLHAQAIDVREAGRRRLIEEGGKREIAMMVPVIFLILPVTVVFAIFPGIVAIRIGI